MTRLSIVIPTLNEAQYLPRLLDSIKAQDFSDYEVIVSDGNSEDRTRDIAKDRGCLVVSQEKRSPASQRNAGAKQARGGIILFLDADNLLPPGFLSSSVDEFANRNLDVAGFYLNFHSTRPIYRLFSWTYNLGCFLAQKIFPISVGVGIMVRKEKHDMIGGFDETIFIGEDYDYTKRIFSLGKYRMIRTTHIEYSVRRLEKEGVLRVLGKWTRGTLYFIFRGPIRKKIVKYEFGQHKDER